MLDKLKKFILQMMVGANIVTIIIMLIVGFCYKLNPQEHPIFANIGLAFPLLLLINLAFLVLFMFFKRLFVIIPILGFIVCYIPTRKYSPINVPRATPEDAIKIMSYNVFAFKSYDSETIKEISDYINNSGASIVCLQEASYDENIHDIFKKEYKYQDTLMNRTTGEIQCILSKFPVLSKNRLNKDLNDCLCGAYEVLINGDRTTVINCHLKGSGLSSEERKEFHSFVKGDWKNDTIRQDSKKMIVRLGEAAKNRVPQVEGVIQYIKSRKGEPIILFGDFNDSPISYCHDLMAKTLNDCYIATANGPGISYHYNTIYVRIDNIMCSDYWEPFNFKVDRYIAASDHYPIYGFVKKSHNKGKKSH